MDRLIVGGGAAEGPAGLARPAMLLLALLGPAVAAPFLLVIPLPNHRVLNPEPRPAAMVAASAHVLDIGVDGAMRFDGEPVGFVEFRDRLELIASQPSPSLAVRPDSHVRYESFLEALVVTRWAAMEEVRIDNAPFERAIDPD